MKLFTIHKPSVSEAPIIISFPHSGTYIPSELKDHFREEAMEQLDDTDWFLPQLYNWASAMGITTIEANYSRWVIDVNRDPENVALYNDGRLITGICPTHDFLGNDIYKKNAFLNSQEINRRKEQYYFPYHNKIQELLNELKSKFGKVLLYDAHSIKAVVKSIRPNKFPDLILGTAEGKSADNKYIETVQSAFSNSSYTNSYNEPFKGGYITRTFGKPEVGQHALQVERCKTIYMDNAERQFDEQRANKLRAVLIPMFEKLIEQLIS